MSLFSESAPVVPLARAVARSFPEDVVVWSHLRWGFVTQRPQHIMTRLARLSRVFFVEEPILADGEPRLEVRPTPEGVTVVVPHLPGSWSSDEQEERTNQLMHELFDRYDIHRPLSWFYTPMMLPITEGLEVAAVVFDCMDELSAFAGAPPLLRQRERELLDRADVVFTGGVSLWESKRAIRKDALCLPSSVDVQHFGQARKHLAEPVDQAAIPRPRLGFFGVIDERMDLELLDGLAEARPDWHIVLVGPIVKIDPSTVPSRPNVHTLGPKRYEDLPRYLSGWDVALLPFALNEATRFISPTKTPEYMAGGKPVVSTPIRDVVRPYGEHGLVRIAADVQGFVERIEACLAEDATDRLERFDLFLQEHSWDLTVKRMTESVEGAVRKRTEASESTVSPIAATT